MNYEDPENEKKNIENSNRKWVLKLSLAYTAPKSPQTEKINFIPFNLTFPCLERHWC